MSQRARVDKMVNSIERTNPGSSAGPKFKKQQGVAVCTASDPSPAAQPLKRSAYLTADRTRRLQTLAGPPPYTLPLGLNFKVHGRWLKPIQLLCLATVDRVAPKTLVRQVTEYSQIGRSDHTFW